MNIQLFKRAVNLSQEINDLKDTLISITELPVPSVAFQANLNMPDREWRNACNIWYAGIADRLIKKQAEFNAL